MTTVDPNNTQYFSDINTTTYNVKAVSTPKLISKEPTMGLYKPFVTVYDYEHLTTQEIVSAIIDKLNELIDALNAINIDLLLQEVTDIINNALNNLDDRIKAIIASEIQSGKYDSYFNNLATNIANSKIAQFLTSTDLSNKIQSIVNGMGLEFDSDAFLQSIALRTKVIEIVNGMSISGTIDPTALNQMVQDIIDGMGLNAFDSGAFLLSDAFKNRVISIIDEKIILSNYYTKSETYNKAEVYNKTESYNKTEVYNKPEVDALIANIPTGGGSSPIAEYLQVYESNADVDITSNRTTELGAVCYINCSGRISTGSALEPNKETLIGRLSKTFVYNSVNDATNWGYYNCVLYGQSYSSETQEWTGLIMGRVDGSTGDLYITSNVLATGFKINGTMFTSEMSNATDEPTVPPSSWTMTPRATIVSKLLGYGFTLKTSDSSSDVYQNTSDGVEYTLPKSAYSQVHIHNTNTPNMDINFKNWIYSLLSYTMKPEQASYLQDYWYTNVLSTETKIVNILDTKITMTGKSTLVVDLVGIPGDV